MSQWPLPMDENKLNSDGTNNNSRADSEPGRPSMGGKDGYRLWSLMLPEADKTKPSPSRVAAQVAPLMIWIENWPPFGWRDCGSVCQSNCFMCRSFQIQSLAFLTKGSQAALRKYLFLPETLKSYGQSE